MGHNADSDTSYGSRHSNGTRSVFDVRPKALSGGDLIREVCGVSASEILQRCAQIRELRNRLGPVTERLMLHASAIDWSDAKRWRLLDLGDGSREEFVEAVHLALLCRGPHANEVVRRIAQLRAGRTRLEVILRLALSAEGRRLEQHCVAGIGLPALLRVVRGLEYLVRSPIMAPLLRATRH
jgi:hypothetical protein